MFRSGRLRALGCVLASVFAWLAWAACATAEAGEWTGTVIDRQVIMQADRAHDETYVNTWTIGADSASFTFSLTGVTRIQSLFCGQLTGTYASAGTGSTNQINVYVSEDPTSPTGARLSLVGVPGVPFDNRSTGEDCVQYAPGLFRIEGSEVTWPFFPYPINDHPQCPGLIVRPGVQAIRGGVTCTAGDLTATYSVNLRRTACDATIDADGGGLGDCAEHDLGRDPSDPLDDTGSADADGDGLSNAQEQSAGSDPDKADTDGDGVPDGVETNGGQTVDTDGDGLVDAADLDSDNDGIPDADEPPGDSDGDGISDIRDPGGALTLEQAVEFYAPEVHLYPDDPSAPMSPDRFIARSKLRWAVPLCTDLTVSKSPRAAKLASGGYRQHAIDNQGCRVEEPDSYSSRELTALSYKQRTGPPGQGFYLDLDDAVRKGDTPSSGSYDNAPPLYYSAKGKRYIVYWFFYANNPREGDRHEGDWERIAIHLGADNRATEVAYFQHFCDPRKADHGLYTWTEMEQKGYLARASHPIVYSAKGGHASYPVVFGTVKAPCHRAWPGGGVLDTMKPGGPIWQTWLPSHELRDATDTAWYGYGGAWGSDPASGIPPLLGGLPNLFGKGPLGPHRKVNPTGVMRW